MSTLYEFFSDISVISQNNLIGTYSKSGGIFCIFDAGELTSDFNFIPTINKYCHFFLRLCLNETIRFERQTCKLNLKTEINLLAIARLNIMLNVLHE